MDKRDVQIAKKKILKALTEDFEYGLTKAGKPLKRRRKNQAIFIKTEDGFGQGRAIFAGTDLEMVMDKVVLGLYLAIEDSWFTLTNKKPKHNQRCLFWDKNLDKLCLGIWHETHQSFFIGLAYTDSADVLAWRPEPQKP